MTAADSSKSTPVNVRILDREYTVGVSEDERANLSAAARLLDARMREIRGGNKMVGLDRLAVLAALNLAHELQQRGDGGSDNDALFKLLDETNAKLDALIGPATA